MVLIALCASGRKTIAGWGMGDNGQNRGCPEGGRETVIGFTIRPPQNAQPGEHNGCIVMQDKRKTAGFYRLTASY
jgi:hypothetical protein